MTRQHKQQRPVEVKFPDNAPDGSVRVVFAQLNVRDHDGDVILSGAVPERKSVPMSAYGHASWAGALPVGKGEVFEDGEQLIFDGQFFTSTQAGREHYETVKGLGDLQEWSFGFDIKQESFGEHDGEQVRFLQNLDIHETSPVLLGAGIGTHTAAIKQVGADPGQATVEFRWPDRGELVIDPELVDRAYRAMNDPDNILTKHGRPLQQHREAVLEAAHDLVDRYTSLADADREKGRVMSSARCEQMTALADALEQDAKALRTILEEQTPEEPEMDDVDGMKLWLQWQETQYRIREVAYDGV